MTDNNDESPNVTASGPIELETGIFNLVVTLCKLVACDPRFGDVGAKEHVATYLDRLAAGLRASSAQDQEERKE